MAIKCYSDINTSPYSVWGTNAGWGLPTNNVVNKMQHMLVIRVGDISGITPDWRIPVFWRDGTSTHITKFGINSSKQFYSYANFVTAGATTNTANTVTIDPWKWYVLISAWTTGWPFSFWVYELENPFTPDVTIGTSLQSISTGNISDTLNYNDGLIGFGFNGGASAGGAIISYYAYFSDDTATETERKNWVLGKYPEGMPNGKAFPDIEYRFDAKINGESKNIYFDGDVKTPWNIQAGNEWSPDPIKFLDEPKEKDYPMIINKRGPIYGY